MKIGIEQELRPCKIRFNENDTKLKNALFYCVGNINNEPYAIVELESGYLTKVDIGNLQFFDSKEKFKEYYFEENPN